MNSSHEKVLVIVLTTVVLMSALAAGQMAAVPAVAANDSTVTPTATPIPTATVTGTETASPTPTTTPSTVATATPTATPTANRSTPTATATSSETETRTGTETPSPTPTPTPDAGVATAGNTQSSTPTPTPEPETQSDSESTPTNGSELAVEVVAPETVTAGEAFNLSASVAGGEDIETYIWQFPNGTTAQGANATYTILSPGNATIAVTAAGENVTQTTETVTVQATPQEIDEPPTALFHGSPYISEMGTTITFDASSSSDDIAIVEYRWDFDGDGTVDETTGPSESETNHAYSEPGRQRATVTVVDSSNQTDTYANAVYAYDPDDETRPTATVHVPETVDVNETFTVEKTNLTDRSGVPYGDWYFDDRKVGDGASATGSFAESGIHSVTLVLVDAAGNRNMYTRQVIVGTLEPKDSDKPDHGHRNDGSDDRSGWVDGGDDSDDGTEDEPRKEFDVRVDSDGGSGTTVTAIATGDREEFAVELGDAFGDGVAYDVETVRLKRDAGDDVTMRFDAIEPNASDAPERVLVGYEPLSYLSVGPDDVGSDVEDVSVTFTIDEQRLADLDANATDVALYRLDGDWRMNQTVEFIERTDDGYRYRTTVSAPGTIVVGANVPSMSVANVTVNRSTVASGAPIQVRATVTNDGRAPGVFTTAFLVDGAEADAVNVSVPAGQSRTVAFTTRMTALGAHTFAVGDRNASVIVEQTATPTPTETATLESETASPTATDVPSSPTDGATETPDLSESPGTPGFGITAAVLALLAALVAAVRD